MSLYHRRRGPAALIITLTLLVAGCAGVSNVAGPPIPLPYGGGAQITSGIPFIIMGGTDDTDLTNIYQSSVPFPTPTSGWTAVTKSQVLTGDFIQIGLNRGGAMVTPGSATQPTPFLEPGVADSPAYIGFASRQDKTKTAEYDVMIPGCACEGWAVKFTAGGQNYWGGGDGLRGDTGGGVFNSGAGTSTLVSAEKFSDGTNFAVRSVVDVGPMRVTLVMGLRKGDRYASFNITLTNTGTAPITNIRFDRSLDFDIDAAAGGSFSTDRWKVLTVGGVQAISRGRGTVQNPRYYAIATRSPYLSLTDAETFYNTDPDSFTAGDPNDAAGDFSSTFVFKVPTLDAGKSVTL